MTQERLNSLLTLNVHKDITDSSNLISVANEFVSYSEHRLSTFGKFTELDIISGGFCMKCKSTLNCEQCVLHV